MKANLEKMLELARAHMDAGGIRAAEVYWRMILKAADPPGTERERIAVGDACAFFARRALYNRHHGEAADWFQRAVFADPVAIDYRLEYIVSVLLPLGMFKNARIEAERATKIDPSNPDAWRALAISLAALGEPEESAAAYDRQVALDAGNPLARIDRATLAINVGNYDVARYMIEPIIAGDFAAHEKSEVAFSEAIHTLALIAYRESRHEDAITLYRRALEGKPQDPAQVRWNMSLALHAIGRYREGWVESENRGQQKADEPMRLVMSRFTAPMMTPAELDTPCRLHVHQEMGNGDAIAMARYLPLLVAKGHDVRLETLETLVPLFRRSFPQVKVMPRAIDYPSALGIPLFDRHIPTLSLPWLFDTDIDTVPWSGPYLTPDPIMKAHYGEKLGPARIGLCWSSGIRKDNLWISEYGRRKSMHFDDVAHIVDGRFVSLQVGPERAQARGILDILPEKPTWDDTAALISNLDLVITVDTAVAHLAGALGVPTWVMMQRDGSSWHFMCWRPDEVWNEASPWYPSVRIFRQREFNRSHYWDDVIDDVASSLHEAVVPAERAARL